MLAVVLFLTVPLAGLDSVWSADEGALLYQATHVGFDGGLQHDTWSIDHPFPAADPTGEAFPFHLSVRDADDGYLVLAKHTILTRLAAGLYAVGGYPAVIGMGAVGTWFAAVAAARLAWLVDRRAARPALWLTGIASPLFISSFVAWGHTITAAFVGWAAYLLYLGALRRRSAGQRWTRIGGAALLAVACVLRTEAALAGIAVTAGLAIVGLDWSQRQLRPSSVPAPRLRVRWRSGEGRGWRRSAMAALGATIVGVGIDAATAIPYNGVVTEEPDAGPFWSPAARFDGFSQTWLQTSYTGAAHDLLTAVAAVAVIAAGVLLRRGQERATSAVLSLGLAVVAIAARAIAEPTMLVPGLVVAFPLLFAGAALTARSDIRHPAALASTISWVLFALAVLATQYRYGGGGEWGGRYFAIGLPLAIAAICPGIVRTLDQIDRPERRRLVALAITPVIIMMVLGIAGMRDVRRQTSELTDSIQAVTAPAGDGDDRPVIVTTVKPLARWSWDDVNDGRWLLVDPAELPSLAARLRTLDIDRAVLVTEGGPDELTTIESWYAHHPIDSDTGPADRPADQTSIVYPLVAVDRP